MSIKNNYRLIIASIGFSVLLMVFAPHGSLNPHRFGFYWSILTASTITLSINWLLPKFFARIAKRLEMNFKIEIRNNEKLELVTSANHFKGVEGVGGKLFLTDQRLVFKSHRFNIQNHEQEFDPNKIEKIETPKGKELNFEYEGKLEKFIVDEPTKWCEKLQNR